MQLEIKCSKIELHKESISYQSGFHLKVRFSKKDRFFNLFFWSDSNVLFIDSNSNLDAAHSILDILYEHIHLKVRSIQPTSEQWINFMREGELLRAFVATRWGLQDISQKDDFSWEDLVSTPLVSATISFRSPKPFLVYVGSSTLTIHEPLDIEIIGFLAFLVTKHIMNGEKLVESNHKN